MAKIFLTIGHYNTWEFSNNHLYQLRKGQRKQGEPFYNYFQTYKKKKIYISTTNMYFLHKCTKAGKVKYALKARLKNHKRYIKN